MKKLSLILTIIFFFCMSGVVQAETEKPAPAGDGVYVKLDGENTLEGVQTADGWTTPPPSVKGYPDTLTIRNSTDVPVIQYAPEHITIDVYRPTVSEKLTKITAYTIPATEAYNYIFTQTGSAAEVEFDLPASTVGMRLAFIVGDIDGLKIDPDGSEQILDATGASGDYIVANAVNELIVLECFVVGFWHPTYTFGDWTEE
jgi:hypothetical protein